MADISDTPKRVEGGAASGAAVAGNPLLDGGEARTTLPTAVSDGEAVSSMHDDVGRQVVAPHCPRDLVTHNTITLSTTTETTLIAAGGAGVFRDLVFLMISNTDSNESVRIDFRDSTGGTVRFSVLPASDGGGAVIPFPVPITQATAANNWTAQLSGSLTGGDIRVFGVAVDGN